MAGVAGMGTPEDIQGPVGAQDLGASLTPQVAKLPANPSPQATDQGAPAALAPNATEPQAPDVSQIGQPNAQDQALAQLDALNGHSGGLHPNDALAQLDALNGKKTSLSDISDQTAAGFGYKSASPQANDSTQTEDLGAQAKASFAMTPKEKKAVLEEHYGAGNVDQVGDSDNFKVKGADGKIRTLVANSGFMGFLASHARTALEASTAIGTGLAADAVGAGEAATGVGVIPGIATAVAGNAASAVMAKKAGDVVAQQLLGIPRDPARNEFNEDVTAGTIGGVAGGAFKAAGMGISAIKAAAQASEVEQQAATKSVDDFLQQVTNYKNVSQDVDTGFKASFQETKQTAGGGLGKMRATALNEAGNAQLPATNTSSQVTQLASDLGYAKQADGSFQYPEADQISAKLRFPNDKSADAFKGILDDLHDDIQTGDGRLTLKDVYDYKRQVSDELDAYAEADRKTTGFRALTQLKQALTADDVKLTGSVLEGTGQQGATDTYSALNGQYADYLKGEKMFSDALRNPNTAEKMADSVFQTGIKGLRRATIAEKVIQPNNPELWDNITGQWVTNRIQDATKIIDGAPQVDWGTVAKSVNKLGGKGRELLFGSPELAEQGTSLLGDLARVQSKNADTFSVSSALIKASKLGLPTKTLGLMLGGSGILSKISEDGLENVISKVPAGATRNAVRDMVNGVLAIGSSPTLASGLSTPLYNKANTQAGP